MGDKKSPTRPKRQPKPSSDEGYWDCSVCTFRNSAEAFKCMMCDVRKGTSTRDSKEGGKLVSYSTASLGVRGTPRNRVGGGSSEEKKQAEYLAPGRRRNIVRRGVGPGQRSGPSLRGLRPTWGPLTFFFFTGTSELL
ncbi:YY1-associated factor 2 isoform X6 [Cebus imitator]|uniref:YY1 associated factor 2 n=1 Tax=Cebus imitator TaxID=2715852 RepID=A0A2K5PJE9_CEBIM|nr:YY1-associated factor 2 isoform X6 [Cebus imitator]